MVTNVSNPGLLGDNDALSLAASDVCRHHLPPHVRTNEMWLTASDGADVVQRCESGFREWGHFCGYPKWKSPTVAQVAWPLVTQSIGT
jgi:hypothetical protein